MLLRRRAAGFSRHIAGLRFGRPWCVTSMGGGARFSSTNSTTQRGEAGEAEYRTHSVNCAVNDNGVLQPLQSKDYLLFALSSAIPMIGFGFMDNTIMIQAGELIDMSFGVRFGLSTLTAAAVGQLFSDASGVCFGSTVDNLVCRLFPRLQQGEIGKRITAAHLQTGSPYAARLKFLRTFSAVAGVMIGCCLGMTQLLFMDLKKAERLKALQQCRPLFVTLMEEGHELLNCQRCALYLKVDDTAGPVSDPNTSDYDLWMAGMPSESNSISDSEEKLESRMRAWRTMEQDKDGYISTNDLAAVVTKMGYKSAVGQALDARSDNQVAEILASCEVKGDRISFEQFDRVMPKLIKLINQDCRFSPKQRPLLEHVLRTGEVLRIDDVESPMLNKTGLRVDPNNMDRYRGVRTHSVLICPVVDPKTGTAIGVVECVNKYRKHHHHAVPSRQLNASKRNAPEIVYVSSESGPSGGLPSTPASQSSASTTRKPDPNKIQRTQTVTHDFQKMKYKGFTDNDVKIVTALCSHAATFARQCGFIED